MVGIIQGCKDGLNDAGTVGDEKTKTVLQEFVKGSFGDFFSSVFSTDDGVFFMTMFKDCRLCRFKPILKCY